MRIAVIGDSILWGQGLDPGDKIAEQVARTLAARPNYGPVEVVSYAHSGADVWLDGESDIDLIDPIPEPIPPLQGVPSAQERAAMVPSPDAAERARWGELPADQAYSLVQVDRAARELAGRAPDVILLDAGANDVNITNLVLPFKSRTALRKRAWSAGDRLRWLLEHTHETFPESRLVVTGYYPVLTEASDVGAVLRFAAQFLACIPSEWLGRVHVSPHLQPVMTVASLLERDASLLEHTLESKLTDAGLSLLGLRSQPSTLAGLLIAPLHQRLDDLSTIFADTLNATLAAQVTEFNERYRTAATFVVPSIPAEHAMQTREPWVFGLGPALEPTDPRAEHRRALCEEKNAPLHLRFLWERASVGHPNARGARAYAEAIVAQWPLP